MGVDIIVYIKWKDSDDKKEVLSKIINYYGKDKVTICDDIAKFIIHAGIGHYHFGKKMLYLSTGYRYCSLENINPNEPPPKKSINKNKNLSDRWYYDTHYGCFKSIFADGRTIYLGCDNDDKFDDDKNKRDLFDLRDEAKRLLA